MSLDGQFVQLSQLQEPASFDGLMATLLWTMMHPEVSVR